jgi:hypothetical protein
LDKESIQRFAKNHNDLHGDTFQGMITELQIAHLQAFRQWAADSADLGVPMTDTMFLPADLSAIQARVERMANKSRPKPVALDMDLIPKFEGGDTWPIWETAVRAALRVAHSSDGQTPLSYIIRPEPYKDHDDDPQSAVLIGRAPLQGTIYSNDNRVVCTAIYGKLGAQHLSARYDELSREGDGRTLFFAIKAKHFGIAQISACDKALKVVAGLQYRGENAAGFPFEKIASKLIASFNTLRRYGTEMTPENKVSNLLRIMGTCTLPAVTAATTNITMSYSDSDFNFERALQKYKAIIIGTKSTKDDAQSCSHGTSATKSGGRDQGAGSNQKLIKEYTRKQWFELSDWDRADINWRARRQEAVEHTRANGTPIPPRKPKPWILQQGRGGGRGRGRGGGRGDDQRSGRGGRGGRGGGHSGGGRGSYVEPQYIPRFPQRSGQQQQQQQHQLAAMQQQPIPVIIQQPQQAASVASAVTAPTIQANPPAPSAGATFGQGRYARLSNPPGPRENGRLATGPSMLSSDCAGVGVSSIMLEGRIEPIEEGYRGRTESDNHADTHALGKNFTVMWRTGRTCDVTPFTEKYKPMSSIEIVMHPVGKASLWGAY